MCKGVSFDCYTKAQRYKIPFINEQNVVSNLFLPIKSAESRRKFLRPALFGMRSNLFSGKSFSF
ncbi:MAG TPA: hypothetical protein DDZ96_11640 [Porphyromonadaceae bacterium]|nr:hypothetical protein [Porphyromonadaceae bacterium]HBL34450.1 hypothetical protein [Porphyromonadaceae bacterium]HBX46144.1 hypothetical protein [Porphyromonadaceae bacterium]HCM21372.1 hypothetical protein [Porphyromonadaceae bacterium]